MKIMELEVKLILLKDHLGYSIHELKWSSVFKNMKQQKEKLIFGFLVILESREPWDLFQIPLFIEP